jgi:hypothetical protein
VIGLGGIGQKIRQIVETLQKPVNKALDFLITQGLKLAGPLIRGLTNLGGKAKAKAKAGVAWAKGKAEAGKAWAKEKASAVKAKLTPKDRPGPKDKDGKAAPPASPQAALDRAAGELPGKYAKLLGSGPSRSAVVSQTQQWKASYGLQDLKLNESGGNGVVVARLTPREVAHVVIAANQGGELHRMIREVAMDVVNRPDVLRQVMQIIDDRRQGQGQTAANPRATQSPAAEATALMYETRDAKVKANNEYLTVGGEAVRETQKVVRQGRPLAQGPRPGQAHVEIASGGKYTDIKPRIEELQARTGASHADVMRAVDAVQFGGPLPASLAGDPANRAYLAHIARLLYAVEPGRNPASLITGGMAAEVVTSIPSRGRSAATAVTGRYNTMAPEEAGAAARRAGRIVGAPVPSRAKTVANEAEGRALLAKEQRLIIAYLTSLIAQKKLVFADTAALHDFIQHEMRDYLAREIGNKMSQVYQP